MIQDLSVEHWPVSSLFPAVNDRTIAVYELHPKQVDFFNEYGYLSGVRILSDEQVEGLREELTRGCPDFCVIGPYFPREGCHADQERDCRRAAEGR